jgi:hypothetical protein
MNLEKYLTISIPTHILPSAPSTDIIQNTIDSIRSNFMGIDDCKFVIYCDSWEEGLTKELYIKNLNDIKNVTVVDRPQGGLQANYLKGVADSNTPFVFCCEHDWTFLREIDTPKLIKAMLKYDFINFVRFNKRDNNGEHPHVCAIPALPPNWEAEAGQELEVTEQPLMKSHSTATHPHIVRRAKFITDWWDIAQIQGSAVGQIEMNLFRAYANDINQMGFTAAHKNWGVYNYGSESDLKIIAHTDGSDSGR